MKLGLPARWRNTGLRPGLPGALGAGGLALCLAFYVSAVQPAQQRLETARLDASALQAQLARAAQAGTHKRPALAEQLAAFYQMFPGEQEATERIGAIAALAQRDGLELQQADYTMERDKGGKLTRLQVNLPLKGEYRTIRRFLSDLRAELPIVALEQLQLERQKVGDAQVDAKVRLVIFLGQAS